MAASDRECAWECDPGYFTVPGLPVCNPCTRFNATTCPAGFKLVQCDSALQRDSSCDIGCPVQDLPHSNYRWVKVALNQTLGQLVPDDDPEVPNQGCVWECEPGFRLVRSLSGVSSCVSVQIPP